MPPDTRPSRRVHAITLAALPVVLMLGLCGGWNARGYRERTKRLEHNAQAAALVGTSDVKIEHRIKVGVWRRFPRRGKIVMVGDSHTDFADWTAMVPQVDIINRGIVGDTTAAVLARFDTIADTGASIAVLMLGTNDGLLGLDPATTQGNYENLLRRLADAGLRPIVVSVPLTRLDYLNERIAPMNAGLITLCRAPACTYLDLNASIAPTGTLDARLTVDGIHLNGDGYARWAELLAPHLHD